MLDRNVKRIAEVSIKYSGFTIGDEYVVGYGLDYKQNFRNLDSIYRLNTAIIKKEIEVLGNLKLQNASIKFLFIFINPNIIIF